MYVQGDGHPRSWDADNNSLHAHSSSVEGRLRAANAVDEVIGDLGTIVADKDLNGDKATEMPG